MARASRRGTDRDEPKIEALRLPELEDADPDAVVADSYREAERLTGADLTGRALQRLVVDSSEWLEVEAGDADLSDSRFADSRLVRFRAPVLRAPGSEWRDVLIEDSRIGSAELREASLRSVRFVRCKLGYVGLRGATLMDVVVEDCIIDEFDLGGAEATRVAFRGSSATTLDVTSSRLRAVDLRGLEMTSLRGLPGLRGARVSGDQLMQLAPLLAAEQGITVD
ncbi:MAG TPA: pentapeptide repeat-containing protein [Naasia sp.]|jgi:uncharacterized protein YjbI with pentapeptide repeats